MERGTQSHKKCALVPHGCGTIVYKGNIKKLLLNYSLLLLGVCTRWNIWKIHRPTHLGYLWYGIPKQGRERNVDLKNAIQSINGVLKTEPHISWGFSGTLSCLCHYLPSQIIAANTLMEIALFTSIQSHFKQARSPLHGLILLVIIVYLELVVEKQIVK